MALLHIQRRIHVRFSALLAWLSGLRPVGGPTARFLSVLHTDSTLLPFPGRPGLQHSRPVWEQQLHQQLLKDHPEKLWRASWSLSTQRSKCKLNLFKQPNNLDGSGEFIFLFLFSDRRSCVFIQSNFTSQPNRENSRGSCSCWVC